MQVTKIILITFVLFAAFKTNAVTLEEGVHYERVSTLPSERKFVSVYFNYGCPGCYKSESLVKQVKSALPKDVQLEHVPFENNPSWKIYVQAFFIADMLKLREKMHEVIFHRIHVEKKPIGNLEQLKTLFVANGADPKRFDQAAKSFQLDSKEKQARQNAVANRILSTPTFVVNDRFRLNANQFKSNKELVDAILELINR
ncbi:MAG: thiol:disulfide interchange protein DsbA/DsbL [Gammaproteobacteria bacterium]|nr:thiol:disulfide interchange protein DsbA/DsbL [Gammaproteobacteria bacterium]